MKVLFTIVDTIGERGYGFPSLATLAGRVNVNRTTVVRAVANLVRCRYLRRRSGSRTKSNEYEIHPDAAEVLAIAEPLADGDEQAETAEAGRCVDAPTHDGGRCADAPTGRCVDAPRVGAPVHHQLAYITNPIELAQKQKQSPCSKPSRKPPVESSPGFESFWRSYPSKVNRKGAWKIWLREDLEMIAKTIVSNVEARKLRDTRWDGGFVPNPTTFLNQERWTAEPYTATNRESAAGRAERLGNDALRRLGEDDRDDAELIAEMTQAAVPWPLQPAEEFP